MKHRFLELIAVLPLALAGCCCVPTPVCMQPPGCGLYAPGPQFAPAAPMYRPYAPVTPVVPVAHQSVPHQRIPRFPVRRPHGLIRHGWPITQAYSTAVGERSRPKCQTCSDCLPQCNCNCEDQIHVCKTQHACKTQPPDCAAPCGEGCSAEPGCYAPFDTGMESRVFTPPGAAHGELNSGLNRIEPPPVPPTPPAPNDAVPEAQHGVQLDVPSAAIRRVNYVSLNGSMPPEDFDRSHVSIGLDETFERTTIPATTVVHKRIQ